MAREEFKQGTSFKEPKLYRFTGTASEWEVEVIRPWPDPQAWIKRSAHAEWLGWRPRVDLGRADRPPSGLRSWRARHEARAYSSVPQPVRQVVSRYSPSVQWRMLSLTGRVDGALELASSNPALAAALALSNLLRQPVRRPLRSARALVRRKRRAILQWLGFPPTRAAVRAFSRVPAASCSVRSLRLLGTALRYDQAWTRHLPVLNESVLMLLGGAEGAWPTLTGTLLEEIGSLEPTEQRNRSGGLVRQLLDESARAGVLDRLPPLRSLEQVQVLLSELRQEFRFLLWGNGSPYGPFPIPPYPSQELAGEVAVQMEPLHSISDVTEHGEEQRNCLSADHSYIQATLGGRGYIYSLSWQTSKSPRTATLFLDSIGLLQPRWGIGELRLRANEDAPRWLTAQVRHFLARSPSTRLPHLPAEEPESGLPNPMDDPDPRQLELPFWDPEIPF